MIEDLPSVFVKKNISTYEIFQGSAIPAIDRLSLMSDKEFEQLTLEWANGYLKKKYSKVRMMGGAGDMGRDIVGYYDDDTIDIYQCKHYKNALTPSKFFIELGKLCYYTYKEEYPIPKSYFIVTSQGVGGALLKLIEKPETLKAELIKNWSDKCEKIITKKQDVPLKGDFLEYIKGFNFSIITDKSPLELIDEYRTTVYYPSRFGGGLNVSRPDDVNVSDEILERELEYTGQLYKVYTEHTCEPIKEEKDLVNSPKDIQEHFKKQRESFFCAESLEKFSRDNFPDVEVLPFDKLKIDALDVISTNLNLQTYNSGWIRMESSMLELNRQDFMSNPLSMEIRPADKRGIGHHLINERKVKWINDEE